MFLSCGHRVEKFEDAKRVTTKEHSRDWQRAIGYRSVCPLCFKFYEKENLIFYSDKEALEWLCGG